VTDTEPPSASAAESLESAVTRDEPRNVAALAFNAVLIRIGWIFKTESVIIPAFLDSVAGAGWLRGLLPILNRLGQSVPPFLLSRRLKITPLKKHAMLLASVGMALPFLVLAAGLGSLGPRPRPWYPAAFLVLYTLFFCFLGLLNLAHGTLQGKLVRPQRRGRLLALSTIGGSLPAVVCAWWLLPDWLEAPGWGGWAAIFGFAGSCFAASALCLLAVREPRDDYHETSSGLAEQLRGAWQVLRADGNYRRLVLVGVLFTTSLILIPHYQALARERLDLAGSHLMLWVVVQNLSVAAASAVVGPFADRYGNRLSLRLVVFVTAGVPPLALILSHLEPELGRRLFPLVFVGIGVLPIGLRLLVNYTLEICPESEHTRYLSIAQLCAATVLLSSPFFGLAIDATDFEPVFLAVTALIASGGLLTFRLVEPRGRDV
jgi:predicted MFS family arabinose efflux permease